MSVLTNGQGGNFPSWPYTLALMPREKNKSSYGHSGLCAPGPVRLNDLAPKMTKFQPC